MDGVGADATRFLREIGHGDTNAAERLLPLVYDELKAVAAGLFGGQPAGHSLQPTALVHEAYLKLVRQDSTGFVDRAHFTAVAAVAMRQILVDHARAKATAKRGAEHPRVTLDLSRLDAGGHDVDVLALHETLEKLAKIDERKARMIELRFFGGLDIEQTAEVLGVARSTVTQDWRFARAWLVRELGNHELG